MLKTIGNQIVGLGLETVGTALLGPLGGKVLTTVAERLGVEARPQAVAEKVASSPDAAQQALLDLERDPEVAAASEAYWNMLATNASEVGQTMRAELTAREWYQRAWRPFFGLVFGLVYLGVGAAIVRAIWVGDFEVVNAVASLSVYIGAGAAVLGVYVSGRSKEKLAAMSGDIPISLLERVIGRR